MNYYRPREKKDAEGNPSGIWHYTCQNDDRIWPVGYCREGCPGHDSPEGAFAHQTEWELDHIKYDGEYGGHWEPCAECGELTNRFAEWGTGGVGHHRSLCDKHRTREFVAPHVSAGYVTSSY